ncbi:MAG: type II toxin-antitoxin system VapC family toxin [Vicinamibacterales bacterium]
MIHLDTSALIDAVTGPRRSMPVLRQIIGDGLRIGVSTLVLYEWQRGPRTPEELALARALLPPDAVTAFGEVEARVAAEYYRKAARARGREIDLAIAACAVTQEAELWTLNPADFADLKGLQLYPGRV